MPPRNDNPSKYVKSPKLKVMDIVKKYSKIYFQLVNCAFSSYLSNRLDSIGYFLGKMVRFIFFLILVISIFRFTDNLAGYGMYEVILFFLTSNLIDVSAQFLFRGMYTFKNIIITGHFDYILSKPMNALFYVMNKLVDILDLIFLMLIVGGIIYTMMLLVNKISVQGILWYVLLIMNGMFIVFGIHIFVAALAIRFYESENLIWLYRESMTLGRMPPEIFSAPIRCIFTAIIPIFVMIAFPVKALLGALDFRWVIFAFLLSLVLIIFSLWFWRNSLKYYSSASS